MTQTERKGTGSSALLMVLAGIAIVALVGLIVYAALNIDNLLENLVLIGLVVLAAIIIIVVVVYLLMIILAIPYYAAKGESYQTNVDYDLDDVESVKERGGGDDGKKD
ncbi:MAG: hypothetical protein GX224_03500 [Thermoplasmatales archaeon]|nr:hypothetical protein [Thermoplasmatales archaeon]